MSPSERASLTCCSWDRILGFARKKFPKIGLYGREGGTRAEPMVVFLQNETELARVADALVKIDCAYDAAVAPFYEKIRKATKDREDAEQKLLETLGG